MKDKKNSVSNPPVRRRIMMAVCILMCVATIAAFILLGDSGYEEKDSAKAYVLENHAGETGADNAVTAIYLNYRLWDTIFEAMLLLLSAMAVISFSWSIDHEE